MRTKLFLLLTGDVVGSQRTVQKRLTGTIET